MGTALEHMNTLLGREDFIATMQMEILFLNLMDGMHFLFLQAVNKVRLERVENATFDVGADNSLKLLIHQGGVYLPLRAYMAKDGLVQIDQWVPNESTSLAAWNPPLPRMDIGQVILNRTLILFYTQTPQDIPIFAYNDGVTRKFHFTPSRM